MVNDEILKWMKECMSEEEYQVESKKYQINKLLMEVMFPPFEQFFDSDSNKLLDEKIEVLTALKEGKQISDIPNFYDILELYPKEQEQNGTIIDNYWD